MIWSFEKNSIYLSHHTSFKMIASFCQLYPVIPSTAHWRKPYTCCGSCASVVLRKQLRQSNRFGWIAATEGVTMRVFTQLGVYRVSGRGTIVKRKKIKIKHG
jgi:hypothetical protein